MKYFFLAFLLAGLVFGEDAVKYAGTTTGGATFTVPNFADGTGACTAATDPSPYVVFNHTFASAGVREVAVMAERTFKAGVRVYIYTAFNPAQPCANNFVSRTLIKQRNEAGGPVIDDFINFGASLYYFVISGDAGGIFAINIFPSNSYGSTAVGSPVWPLAYLSSGDCETEDSPGDGAAPFSNYTWTQPATGYYDLQAYFVNETVSSWYVYGALYNGSIADLASLQDPCNDTATGASFITATYASKSVVTLYYVWLVAGNTYTVVFGGSNTNQIGNYGVQILETRVRSTYNSTYTQPARGEELCEASSYDVTAWSSTVFTAEQRAYLLDTSALPSPFPNFDTYSFLYSGLNTGDAANGVAPTTCPSPTSLIIAGDTGDVTPVYTFTTPGKNYTVVVSTYGNMVDGKNYFYGLYLFTGAPIGAIPVPTSPPTTSTTTTSGSPGGASTSGTSSNPDATSTASSVVVGFACIAILVASML